MDCFNCERNGIAITNEWDWDDIKRLCDAVLVKWGGITQIHMAVEESAELQKALMKVCRKDTPATRVAVLEEIADTQIMLWQLLRIFDDCPERTYGEMLNKKLNRLKIMLED